MSRNVYSDAELICQSIEAQTEILSDLVPSREEARLRLTCAALPACIQECRMAHTEAAREAVAYADACLTLLYPTEPAP